MCGDLVGKHQTAKPEPRKQTRSHLQGDYHVQPSLTTKLAATPFIALLFAAAVPTSAYAATYDVAGELNTGGHLVQYSTFRSHIEGGASLHIYNNVGTYSRFGLRNTSGSQVQPVQRVGRRPGVHAGIERQHDDPHWLLRHQRADGRLVRC